MQIFKNIILTSDRKVTYCAFLRGEIKKLVSDCSLLYCLTRKHQVTEILLHLNLGFIQKIQ